eukprot:Hpha_TRINITY_DN11792_c0_g1::TRINITY_DN11792_c0_g1_i1::g.31785::m.31785
MKGRPCGGSEVVAEGLLVDRRNVHAGRRHVKRAGLLVHLVGLVDAAELSQGITVRLEGLVHPQVRGRLHGSPQNLRRLVSLPPADEGPSEKSAALVPRLLREPDTEALLEREHGGRGGGGTVGEGLDLGEDIFDGSGGANQLAKLATSVLLQQSRHLSRVNVVVVFRRLRPEAHGAEGLSEAQVTRLDGGVERCEDVKLGVRELRRVLLADVLLQHRVTRLGAVDNVAQLRLVRDLVFVVEVVGHSTERARLLVELLCSLTSANLLQDQLERGLQLRLRRHEIALLHQKLAMGEENLPAARLKTLKLHVR